MVNGTEKKCDRGIVERWRDGDDIPDRVRRERRIRKHGQKDKRIGDSGL